MQCPRCKKKGKRMVPDPRELDSAESAVKPSSQAASGFLVLLDVGK